MRVTIKEIAQMAGVSPSTVSRVLSGSSRISADTTERVRDIMRHMHYRPNQLARSLVSRKHTIIAVALPSAAQTSLSDPFFYDVLRGISVGAAREGYHVLLSTGGAPGNENDGVAELMHGGIVGGVILLTSKVEDETVESLLFHRFPFVVLGHPVRDAQIHWADNDNVAAGRAVTEYLLSRGCRRIAFAGLDPHYRMTVDRYAGYRAAQEASGEAADFLRLPPSFMLEVPYGDTRVEPSRFRAAFAGPDRPDAVVCVNDLLALEVMRELAHLGLRVPEDVSVIGFNNIQAGLFSTPALTTVEVDAERLGQAAFTLLLRALDHPGAEAAHELVPFRIIERASVR
ncbi:MAG: LacI family transcriptional regulator [Clostridia bacterium]|nr:LacI family transcriptional regulator [Clostridia bacterium]